MTDIILGYIFWMKSGYGFSYQSFLNQSIENEVQNRLQKDPELKLLLQKESLIVRLNFNYKTGETKKAMNIQIYIKEWVLCIRKLSYFRVKTKRFYLIVKSLVNDCKTYHLERMITGNYLFLSFYLSIIKIYIPRILLT